MKKITLAQELRQRQLAQGIVPASSINALADDEIIDAYITCSGCGKKPAYFALTDNHRTY